MHRRLKLWRQRWRQSCGPGQKQRRQAPTSACWLLEGELGAGKTTFTRALVAGLGGDPLLVHSPTFSLVHQYEASVPIFHLDCYRLSDAEEWFSLGIDEQLDQAVTCIEWPSRVAEALPEHLPTWRLTFAHDGDGGREVQVQPPMGVTPRWPDAVRACLQEPA